MYNRVIMMGRIANDPELRTTPSGTNLCTFRLAVERRYQAQGEERKADFFNVAAWRGTGDFVRQYFAKGKMILVEGEMQTRPYTDKNGTQSTWYEIIAERVSFTDISHHKHRRTHEYSTICFYLTQLLAVQRR